MNSRSEIRRLAVQNPDALIREIERLRAENAQLFQHWQGKFPELVSVKKERDELRADNARLREALWAYAEGRHWNLHPAAVEHARAALDGE